jgi:DNA primase
MLTQAIAHPQLAADQPESQLFNELFSLVQQDPKLNIGGILELFKQRPEAKRLAELAALPQTLETEQNQQEFLDIIENLRRAENLNELDVLIAKAKSQALSEQEKQKLRKMLQQSKK